jgi:peroxiredoxin Q/BCP
LTRSPRNEAFADEQGFSFPLLCDVDRSVGCLYGVQRGADEQYPDYPNRMTFLIDREGRIVKVYEVIDADAHADEVLEDLRSLAGSAMA